jgi:hypothetical protein
VLESFGGDEATMHFTPVQYEVVKKDGSGFGAIQAYKVGAPSPTVYVPV